MKKKTKKQNHKSPKTVGTTVQGCSFVGVKIDAAAVGPLADAIRAVANANAEAARAVTALASGMSSSAAPMINIGANAFDTSILGNRMDAR